MRVGQNIEVNDLSDANTPEETSIQRVLKRRCLNAGMQYLVLGNDGETHWLPAKSIPSELIEQYSSKQNKIRRRRQSVAKRHIEQGLREEATRPKYKERVRLNRD